jgi:hypothetical protein
MNAIVTNATYIKEFKIKIDFTNGKISLVDFEEYVKSIKVGYLKKYQIPQNFMNFMIQNGNIVWGKIGI